MSQKLNRYIVYGCILLVASYLRFFIGDNIAFIDPDSPSYLMLPLELLSQGSLAHDIRSYPYPVLTLAILSVFKNINAILYFQHIYALTALLFGFSIIETKWKSTNLLFKKTFFFCLACLFLVVCFWNGFIIFYEKSIRPEGIILPNLIFYYYFIYLFFNNHYNTKKATLFFIVIVAVSLLLGYTHPRMRLAFYATTLIALFWYWKQHELSLNKKIKTLLVGCLTSLVIILPEWYLIAKHDQTARYFAYRQFYFTQLPAINNAVKQGIHVNKEFDLKYVPKMYEKAKEKTKKNSGFQFINYHVDYAQYDLFPYYRKIYKVEKKEFIFASLITEREKIIAEENRTSNNMDTIEFIKQFNSIVKNKSFHKLESEIYFKLWFWKLLKEEPKEVSQKVFRQLNYFFFDPQCLMVRVILNGNFKPADFYSESHQKFATNHLNFSSKLMVFRYPKALIWFYEKMNYPLKYSIIPLFFGLIFLQLSLRRVLYFEMILFGNLFITVFTVALLHTFDLNRYIDSLFPLLLMSVLISGYRLTYFLFERWSLRSK